MLRKFLNKHPKNAAKSAMWRRACFATLFLLCTALAGAGIPGQTQAACKERSLALNLASTRGSQLDALYRPIQDAWRELNGTTLNIVPTTGRGGSYAISNLLRGPDKECSLAAIQVPSFFFLAQAERQLFSQQDVTPVAFFAYLPHALWVEQNSPYQSFDDLILLARGTEEKAGTQLSIAGMGNYTDQHMANLILNRQAGISTRYLPFTTSAEALASVKSKRAHACWGYAMSPESMPGMRPLAVTGQQRSLALPHVPTFSEAGIEIVSGAYMGIAMASSVPEEKRQAIASQVTALLSGEKLRYTYAKSGAALVLLDYDKIGAFMDCRRREAEQLMQSYPLIPSEMR